MTSPDYNDTINTASITFMEEGNCPAMKNEAVTFHEAMRAP